MKTFTKFRTNVKLSEAFITKAEVLQAYNEGIANGSIRVCEACGSPNLFEVEKFGMSCVDCGNRGDGVVPGIREIQEPDEALPIGMDEDESFKKGLQMHDDHQNSHHGQDDFMLWTHHDNIEPHKGVSTDYHPKVNKAVGSVEYSEFRGKPHINMIRTHPEHQHKGVGSAMIDHLAKKYKGYHNIKWGMTTPEGTGLKKAMDAKYKKSKKTSPYGLEEADDYGKYYSRHFTKKNGAHTDRFGHEYTDERIQQMHQNGETPDTVWPKQSKQAHKKPSWMNEDGGAGGGGAAGGGSGAAGGAAGAGSGASGSGSGECTCGASSGAPADNTCAIHGSYGLGYGTGWPHKKKKKDEIGEEEQKPKHKVTINHKGHETAYISSHPTEQGARAEALKWYRDNHFVGNAKPKMYVTPYKSQYEEAPTNNAGSGNIAGLGVGPQGEPGVDPVYQRARKQLKLMNGPAVDPRIFRNKIFARKPLDK